LRNIPKGLTDAYQQLRIFRLQTAPTSEPVLQSSAHMLVSSRQLQKAEEVKRRRMQHLFHRKVSMPLGADTYEDQRVHTQLFALRLLS
jgi:hypothetical protein